MRVTTTHANTLNNHSATNITLDYDDDDDNRFLFIQSLHFDV
jgi:hypothetical protein